MKALLMSLTMSFGFLAVVAHAQAPASAPAGSTGLCKDGSYYSGDSKKGACRGHKGIKEWYGAAASDAGAAPAKTKASRKAKADDAVAAAPATSTTAKPADATGQCKDGSYTTGDSKKGACRGHKGVKEWYAAAAPATTAADAGAMKASTRKTGNDSATAAAPASAPAGSTGLCKDGTYYNGDSKKGACRGHKGVKEWYGAAAAAPAAPSMPAPAPKLAPAPAPMPAPGAAPAAPRAPTPPPAPETRTAAAGGGNGKVWLNTETRVYHCPNDRYYGKTKQGEYLSESDAIAKGAHGSHGKSCTP